MNDWLNYELNQNTYTPKSVNDVISNKYKIIHDLLFDDAKINAIKYLYRNDLFKFNVVNNDSDNSIKIDDNLYIDLSNIKFYEIVDKNSSWYEPSSLLMIKNGAIRYQINLTEFWDNQFVKHIISNVINNITEDIDNIYPFNDIIKYDYTRETATLYNNVESITRKVYFNKISTTDTLKI